MAFCLKKEEGDRVTLFTGSILMSGVSTFREFDECLHTVARQGFKQVVIDFSECVYIDSRAITSIISINRRLQVSGAQLRIQNANQEISELFYAMQLNRIIEMV